MKPDYSQKLEEFENYLKEIPEIIAVYYTGSTASKRWDKYSDIDIDIVVKDKDYDNIKKMLPKLLSWWGEIKLCSNYVGYDEVFVLVNENYLKVEIDPIKESSLKPDSETRKIRIAYDRSGLLTKVYKESLAIKVFNINDKEFINRLLLARDYQFYIARHFMRGQRFSAYSEVTTIRWDLFYLLATAKGLKDFELLRYAEKNLTDKEKGIWESTQLKKETKAELIRVLNANWDFMNYIEKEYEKKTKKKLDLKCDDKEILNRIREIFEGK
jgi:predicted nucleotidyltransferase